MEICGSLVIEAGILFASLFSALCLACILAVKRRNAPRARRVFFGIGSVLFAALLLASLIAFGVELSSYLLSSDATGLLQPLYLKSELIGRYVLAAVLIWGVCGGIGYWTGKLR
jgi:uncharacterized membrane protein